MCEIDFLNGCYTTIDLDHISLNKLIYKLCDATINDAPRATVLNKVFFPHRIFLSKFDYHNWFDPNVLNKFIFNKMCHTIVFGNIQLHQNFNTLSAQCTNGYILLNQPLRLYSVTWIIIYSLDYFLTHLFNWQINILNKRAFKSFSFFYFKNETQAFFYYTHYSWQKKK